MMARSIAERADVLPQLAEVFRVHGYEGATLALISEATGLGKGSLYNFFPGGKEQMAMEVLTSIDQWFVDNIYAPLRASTDPAEGIADMFAAVDDYFRSGQRGVSGWRSGAWRLARPIRRQGQNLFRRLDRCACSALRRLGDDRTAARQKAEQAVLEIQGALVLTRALDDIKVFARALADSRKRLMNIPGYVA
jgi:TetR/AcrR family transcriptional repressor of lmrAB and yxaGH operons